MKRLIQIVGAVAIMAILASVVAEKSKTPMYSAPSAGTSSSTASTEPVQPTEGDRARALMPAEEKAFVAAVENARAQYAAGANEMAKGAARPARGQAICKILKSRQVDGWVGRISSLTTNGDGKGVLAVEITDDAFLETWNNSMSDVGDKTLIEPNSPVFATASKMKVGEFVRVGGSFSQNDVDCVHEKSMGVSGSIKEPQYLFRFTSVASID